MVHNHNGESASAVRGKRLENSDVCLKAAGRTSEADYWKILVIAVTHARLLLSDFCVAVKTVQSLTQVNQLLLNLLSVLDILNICQKPRNGGITRFGPA
jgi:hypothetical protein